MFSLVGPTPPPLEVAAYYSYTSYTGYSSASAVLAPGAATRLSIRFQFCREEGGVLLEALGSSGEYFTVGVTRMQQLLVEFSIAGGITRVSCWLKETLK